MSSPWSKLRYVPPNFFTASSMLLGLGSVTKSAEGDFTLAAWMILWGVLLDKLDGSAARLFRASSEFGVQADSFADFVVFGIAPAALAYFRLRGVVSQPLLLAAAGAYTLCCAGRLARFNISTPPMGDRVFYGIPTTVMGGFLASGYLTWVNRNLPVESLAPAPYLLLVCALLMVSTVKLPKLKPSKSLPFNLFLFANVIAAYVLAPLRLYPEYLFGCCVLFVTGGVGYYLVWPPTPDEPESESAPGTEARVTP
jgi:CDP-diacylglycerol--serine O-phosphatidyltransferase